MRCNICIVVRLWQKLTERGKGRPPRDVPPGHLAISVGDTGRRFVIRTSYLNHPVFRKLLDQAYEVYGHNHNGPLAIPCDEFVFEGIIQSLGDSRNVSYCSCHNVDMEVEFNSCRDSSPLLHSFARRPMGT